MLKKIDILGMQIDNYTVRESIMKAETYLNDSVMNTIGTVNMKMLSLAIEDESVRECIENLDLAVIGEKEILIAAGIHSAQRLKETVDHDFFKEFMKRIIRNRKRVFLLGETNEDVEQLELYLQEEYGKLIIEGTCNFEDMSGDLEGVVNEINSANADVIFSVLPSPHQEKFLLENKGKLDAKIWYALGDSYQTHSGIFRLPQIAGRLIHRKRLQSRLHKYHNENEEK